MVLEKNALKLDERTHSRLLKFACLEKIYQS